MFGFILISTFACFKNQTSCYVFVGSLNLWTIEKLFIPIYAMAEVDLIVYTMPDEVASHLGMWFHFRLPYTKIDRIWSCCSCKPCNVVYRRRLLFPPHWYLFCSFGAEPLAYVFWATLSGYLCHYNEGNVCFHPSKSFEIS